MLQIFFEKPGFLKIPKLTLKIPQNEKHTVIGMKYSKAFKTSLLQLAENTGELASVGAGAWPAAKSHPGTHSWPAVASGQHHPLPLTAGFPHCNKVSGASGQRQCYLRHMAAQAGALWVLESQSLHMELVGNEDVTNDTAHMLSSNQV